MNTTTTTPITGAIERLLWARTGYNRKAHIMLVGRKFACGTPTGYGLLINAKPVTDWGDDPRPIPDYACERCIHIAFPEGK